MRYEEDIKRNFKDHEAKYFVTKDDYGKDMEILRWQRPGSSYYGIIYLRQANTLFVKGDLGEAVYLWGEINDLEWMSKLNLSYFASKCQASEYGRGYKSWDGDVAEEEVKNYFERELECADETDIKERISDFETNVGYEKLFSEKEWAFWLNANYDEALGFFGQDFWEFAYGFGNIVDFRCESHLFGLKMAMEQLKIKV